ncbi:MAG: hypothetical protein H0V17_24730, partial [Deltaproteobacteria bacterium]|nr:hypothetical protein [Deltaproteobacteria bacterium]
MDRLINMRLLLGVARLALVGLASGCELIFTLKEPSELPPGELITGQLVHRTAKMSSPTEVTVDEVPPTSTQVTVRFPDDPEGRVVDVEVADDGTFEFERLGVDYVLDTTVNTSLGASQVTLFESLPSLLVGVATAGRLDSVLVNRATTVLLPVATSTMPRGMTTIGQWTTTTVTNQTMFDWRTAGTAGGLGIGLLDPAQHDDVFILDFQLAAFTPGQTAVIAVGSPDTFAMTDGAIFDLDSVPVVPVSQNGCTHALIQLDPAIERLTTAAGTGFTAAGASWGLLAVPALDTGLAGAVGLLAVAPTPNLAVDVDAPYHDPFPDHQLLLVAVASTPRSLLLDGRVLTLGAVFAYLSAVERGSCPTSTTALVLVPDIAHATGITIDGAALTADEQPVVIERPGEAVVTWTENGSADFYQVVLHEVVQDPLNAGRFRLEQRRVLRSKEPRVAIEAAHLLVNKRYVLTIAATTGYPNLAAGDYLNVSYPATIVTMPSVV